MHMSYSSNEIALRHPRSTHFNVHHFYYIFILKLLWSYICVVFDLGHGLQHLRLLCGGLAKKSSQGMVNNKPFNIHESLSKMLINKKLPNAVEVIIKNTEY
jgi:hypothetical protein